MKGGRNGNGVSDDQHRRGSVSNVNNSPEHCAGALLGGIDGNSSVSRIGRITDASCFLSGKKREEVDERWTGGLKVFLMESARWETERQAF